MRRSRATGEGITPRGRAYALSKRLGVQLRVSLLALIGAATMSIAPAMASDCLPQMVKAHTVAAHARPHRKAAAGAVRKVAYHRPRAKHVSGGKPGHRSTPGLRAPALAVAPLSAPAPRAKPAVFVRNTACPVLPAAAAMSVIPGTIIQAANELPYADLLPAAAPTVAGVDAAAIAPETPGAGQDALLAALGSGIPGSPGGGMLSWGYPDANTGGGGGGTGGGTETPTVPGGPNPPIVVTPPDVGDKPTLPFPPTGGDNPPPLVVTPPGEGGGTPPPGGGTPTAAVPEPATWAMMILGFGLVGSAARRRRPQRA